MGRERKSHRQASFTGRQKTREQVFFVTLRLRKTVWGMVIYSPLLFERQKVDEMAAAIKANRISMKKKIASIEKDIKDKEGYIKKKKESMRENIQKVWNEFPDLEKKEIRRSEENRLRSEKKNANEKIESLSKELSKLGIFSKKRKKEIEAEIDSLKKAVEQIDCEKDLIDTIDSLEITNKIKERLERESEDRKNEITYEDAIALLKDDTLQNIFKEKYPILFKQIYIREKMGNIVQFGRSGDRDIEWRVLEVKDEKCLLIAEKNYYFGFHFGYSEDILWKPWGSSELRQVLNGKFIEETFLPEEQAILQKECVCYDDNAGHDPFNPTYTYYETYDKVFILSKDEALKYFKNDSSRKLESYLLKKDGTVSL